jgi:lipopolysaccharide transport system ATP-binding protein
VVCSAGTLNDGMEVLRDEAGNSRVQITFPNIALLKGTYWLNVYVLCEQGVLVYDRAIRVAELHVAQAGLEQGLVTLPRHWGTGVTPGRARVDPPIYRQSSATPANACSGH